MWQLDPAKVARAVMVMMATGLARLATRTGPHSEVVQTSWVLIGRCTVDTSHRQVRHGLHIQQSKAQLFQTKQWLQTISPGLGAGLETVPGNRLEQECMQLLTRGGRDGLVGPATGLIVQVEAALDVFHVA